MQKISPLRASLDAFNRFKANRAENNKLNGNKNQTNPFGITFKGTMIQMDVFDSSKAKAENKSSVQERLGQAGRLVSSAWVSTLNKFGSMKQSVISFGSRLKQNTKDTWDKLANTKIELNFLKDSPSKLTQLPVSELEEMMKGELATITA